jgi:hypothetical protein
MDPQRLSHAHTKFIRPDQQGDQAAHIFSSKPPLMARFLKAFQRCLPALCVLSRLWIDGGVNRTRSSLVLEAFIGSFYRLNVVSWVFQAISMPINGTPRVL